MFAARLLVPVPIAVCLQPCCGRVPSGVREPVVPGTGVKITRVGDDFEDPDWEYYFRGYKSSQEMDEEPRLPTGEAKNGRWYEGIKRGHPDVVRRVPTPPGGLEGSTGALLLQSLRTGIPGRVTNRMQQDDFVADVNYRLGGLIPASQCPSVVVRVFLPPVDEWEQRHRSALRLSMCGRDVQGRQRRNVLARHVHRASRTVTTSRTLRLYPHPGQPPRPRLQEPPNHPNRLVDARPVGHSRRPDSLLRQAGHRGPDRRRLPRLGTPVRLPLPTLQDVLLQRLQHRRRQDLVHALDHRRSLGLLPANRDRVDRHQAEVGRRREDDEACMRW